MPAVQAPDSEPTAILPDHTVREKTEVDAEANRAVSECNLPAERENDPQSTVSPPELTSQEESTDPEPGPKPPRFSYKKVPSRSEEISIPSEDGESG